MKKILLPILCFMFSMTLAGIAVSAENQNTTLKAPVTQNSKAPVSANKTEAADKVIAQAALDAGVRTCKPLSDQVTRYLIGGGKSAGVVFSAPANANNRIFSSSMEIENNQGVTYASASYSPTGEVGCGVVFDAVTYWKDSCSDISLRLQKDLKTMGTLGGKVSMLDGGPMMRIFLMPAGTGCVQIKKEIVF